MSGSKHLYIWVCMALAVMSCSEVEQPAESMSESAVNLAELLEEPAANPWDSRIDTVIDEGCQRLVIRHVFPLRKTFNDSNNVQLEAAKSLGFNPIRCDEDILHLSRPIRRIVSCEQYFVDDLTHSFPYLVPEAAQLLHDIGQAFNDSLAARGGGNYRIKVTSLLRTPATVRKLKKVNKNATEESTHSYGTTFDISYGKFVIDSLTPPYRTYEDLKNLLGEILYDMREQGRCFVKFEFRQSCFHITTRRCEANKPRLNSL